MTFGPALPISQELHAMKYRGVGESFEGYANRVAHALKDNDDHFRRFRACLLDMRFLPAGRVQAAMGAARRTTPYNCFVSRKIEDSMSGIMLAATEAAQTMRLGGGIGYDFSTLRPRGDFISTLGSHSSGPVEFMDIFDAVCKTIASAGHRRGAQMGTLRVDHPDIEEFIRAKQNSTRLTNFNISVGITDEFMQAVMDRGLFALRWGGKTYKLVDAAALWEEIMRSTWEWAEPGVLFLDTANRMNPLWYCETLEATNPCAEQWLPPHGACLLGSFNLTKYIRRVSASDMPYFAQNFTFDWQMLKQDIPDVVRAMDNIVDRAIYPLPEQQREAHQKRRMGLGITGLANAGEILGMPYGSPKFLTFAEDVARFLKNEAFAASAYLAAEKGSFPLYDRDKYLSGEFIKTLDPYVLDLIDACGIRNSHLTSIAPTGTISLTADNISSGIEPVFCHEYTRTIQTSEGTRHEVVSDYAYRKYGVKGRTATECTADDHLNVLLAVQKHIDSSVSKTCNVSPDMPWEDFKDIYMMAWMGGAKGCTTFNPGGKRFGILNAAPASEENEGAACFIDPSTGKKTCE